MGISMLQLGQIAITTEVRSLSRLQAGLSHMVLRTRSATWFETPALRAPHHEGLRFAAKQDLILRSPPKAGVSKDGRNNALHHAFFICDSPAWRGGSTRSGGVG